MKKITFLLLTTLLTLSLVSCSDSQEVTSTKSVPFKNLSEDFEISDKNMTLYFLDNDDSIPYVNVDSFVSDLNGFFVDNPYTKVKSDLLSRYSLFSNGCKVQFDWKRDEIGVDNMDFFYYIVESSSTTDYSSYIKAVYYGSSGSDEVRFKLSNYGYRVQKQGNGVLIPLVVANTLFCSPNYFNLFYRGDKIFSYYGEIDYSDPLYQTIFNGTTLTNSLELRESTVNSLCFMMDYFYGLKADKGISSFIDYIPQGTLDDLMSLDASLNKDALTSLLITKLDDLHTRIDSVSLTNENNEDIPYYRDDFGTFGNQYCSTRDALVSLRNTAFPDGMTAVRFSGDTAIITLDSFITGTKNQIFDSEGQVKSDAWQYDSYWFMKACMDEVESHGGINDILLDLSLNGGGNIGALIRVFGFITDEYYMDYSYDTLTHEQTLYRYVVDTNRDENYEDEDSYSNYRWTILCGINTFSAANDLITKVKQVEVAKIIGQNSGGGMCSVFPTVLQDGTAIVISSRNTTRLLEGDYLLSTEYGHEPDLEVPYSDFYNDSLLVSYVDSVYNQVI